ncbi:2-succinyl-6-hydroxy-2,4-cyclohexadiene-1-carboxylate synthase [Serratia symbiotica]|uniref:2-succinyl-6-hydroxy-2, 4-cyclohexadiene-1-carboxylate synthase n=1 Tax=Serratia symbiotica TaxID=138074 RepID=UPI00132C3FE7|nr:2-succinyl-6-hydroxy-2,4-cyclohexadiene-1-carboxylate synthase [Serratia symbiotica]MBF1995134.1 2-succinyl-6-hydroxy-2,4-cyclohexadiene-1-carboxylate synthase [Serratia symbiotica]QTP15478.1 2-succinyl-6-hydroxy-2,4-cyclohexadiene-1-carboxylate synthase [Serratia symbiotica]
MRLATCVLQPGEAGRPWLIWLHGLLGNHHEWRAIAACCAQWPSLAIDLSGHGDSVAVTCGGFDDISAQISATVRRHHIERYWLVGYSLGGRIAMYYACHGRHNGLQGAIIEGSNPGLDCEQRRSQRCAQDAAWAERFRRQPITEGLADWYQQPVFTELCPVRRQALITARADNSGSAVADMLEATSLGRQPFLVPQLRQLTVPLRVLCGENDAKFQRLARHAGLPLRIVPRAGHNAHLVNPQDFVTELQDFLVNPG